MTQSATADHNHDLFNDPSAELVDPSAQGSAPSQSNDQTSKLKRTACVLCRKRKLKCDGGRPACATCGRLGHECKYDEVRKKSGPKRGYVKALEARLAQVENLIKPDNSPENNDTSGGANDSSSNTTSGCAAAFPATVHEVPTAGMKDSAGLNAPNVDRMNAFANSGHGQPIPEGPGLGSTFGAADMGCDLDDTFSFEMISLGLEEPLPTQDVIDELDNLFFDRVDQSLPMIHRARYQAAMSLAPSMRPPVCLRYAMWAHSAGVSEKYDGLQSHFYQRARKYLELDEMRGFGQSILTLPHCQAWMLVSMYEFKNMFFPRAWMSTGRAVRLSQMLGLHRLDGTGLDVKMTIPIPRDWTEREERRRTFWLVFWGDRCASIGTGWPMSLEEKDILTNLPGPDANFQNSQPTKTVSLTEALHRIEQDLSSFAGCILMSTLFGRNLTHLHRPEPDDNEGDLNGKFWQRHRSIDAILLNIKLTLPDHLRLPLGMHDPNVVFLNMCLHASAICLHQAAIFKAEKHRLPANVAGESKMRCIAAASEISTIMRTVSHMDLTCMNPFTAFCLYVAARVFVQFLRARPNEQQVMSSLSFLLTAMHAISRKNPLTESFIAQLELDMESAGVKNPSHLSGLERLQKRGVPEYSQSKHPHACVISETAAWQERMNPENAANQKYDSNASPHSSNSQISGGHAPAKSPNSPYTANLPINSKNVSTGGGYIHQKGMLWEDGPGSVQFQQRQNQNQNQDAMDIEPDVNGYRAANTPSSNTTFTPPPSHSDDGSRSQQGYPYSRHSSQGPNLQPPATAPAPAQPQNCNSPSMCPDLSYASGSERKNPFVPGLLPSEKNNTPAREMTLDDFAASNDNTNTAFFTGTYQTSTAAVGNESVEEDEMLTQGATEQQQQQGLTGGGGGVGGGGNAFNAGSPGFPWGQSMTSGTGFTPGPGNVVDPEEFERVLESMGMGRDRDFEF